MSINYFLNTNRDYRIPLYYQWVVCETITYDILKTLDVRVMLKIAKNSPVQNRYPLATREHFKSFGEKYRLFRFREVTGKIIGKENEITVQPEEAPTSGRSPVSRGVRRVKIGAIPENAPKKRKRKRKTVIRHTLGIRKSRRNGTQS